ncbi:hypothetical protein NMN56_022680 [Streptomyces iconiensis]|uniref:Integral membrane protein n=1 Tax=Streptomyces iconiensis TaxID=1384038 RepID=A0ABT7A086_9ACTN|nr:hypothetical protein [Streptomyces iconiensis]MDJ1134716.1 hypothetical protein [Streptomyces iconiensis]
MRVRSTALGVALLPAAAAVILLAGHTTGHFGPGWDPARWAVTGAACAVLGCALVAGLVIARASPAVSPTVTLDERAAPDLYAMVRDLADRLDVPVPSALALTPDCDSWLEDRTHRTQSAGPRPGGPRSAGSHPGGVRSARSAREAAPVLVIGSPFLWWMRVAELRALLAPVVAGTGPSAHPDIAASRRFVRGLDAAVAVAERARTGGTETPRPLRPVHRAVGLLARLMLRAAGPHAAEMERGVAAAASERAHGVDYGLRVVAQEQVGLAYAGWDRLLTRVALPAWRLGLWPTRLDAGVVSALTELSRRDRLAEGFTSRLGERPACDLLEEPGAVDASVSLLAARLFLGERPPRPPNAGPARPDGPGGPGGSADPDSGWSTGSSRNADEAGPDWTPVEWSAYPDEVVDRIWRTEAARLFDVLDEVRSNGRRSAGVHSTEARGTEAHSARAHSTCGTPVACADGALGGARGGAGSGAPAVSGHVEAPVGGQLEDDGELCGPTLARILDRFSSPDETDALAARITAEVARAEAASAPGAIGATPGAALLPGTGETHPAPPAPMGLPLQPPRSGRELLADHVTAAVCCAAVDTAGAAPGLDWLDGPVLLVGGERRTDLSRLVLALVEEGDQRGLRDWLASVGVRPDKPVRLV